MWCVADLDEDYIANMEDTLETYERPYDPQQPVVCLDEKPVTLHADVRAISVAEPGREARREGSGSVASDRCRGGGGSGGARRCTGGSATRT